MLASGFRLVIRAHERVPEVTRRLCARSSEENFTRSFAFQSRKTHCSWRARHVRLSSVSLCRRSRSSKGRLCSLTRMRPVVENCRNLLFYPLPVRLPSKTVSHFSFNADISPFLLTLDQYSCLNSFIPGFEIARPDGLVKMLSYRVSQSLIARRRVISLQFLIVSGGISLVPESPVSRCPQPWLVVTAPPTRCVRT